MVPASTLSPFDDELIRLAAAGERTQIEQLVACLQPCVQRMVIARLSPKPNQWHAVEEIAQEALVGVTKGLPSLVRCDAVGFRAYVSSIVDHKVADRIRQQSRPGKRTGSFRSLYSTFSGSSSAGGLVAWISDSGDTPLTAADQAEQIESMLRHLGKLKEEYRRVLTYAFFDQLKTAEIAELMGISRPAASMMLLRAVRALRSSMIEADAPAKSGGGGDREPAHA